MFNLVFWAEQYHPAHSVALFRAPQGSMAYTRALEVLLDTVGSLYVPRRYLEPFGQGVQRCSSDRKHTDFDF